MNNSGDCIWYNLSFITSLGIPGGLIYNAIYRVKENDGGYRFLKEEFVDAILIFLIHLLDSVCKGFHVVGRSFADHMRIHINSV